MYSKYEVYEYKRHLITQIKKIVVFLDSGPKPCGNAIQGQSMEKLMQASKLPPIAKIGINLICPSMMDISKINLRRTDTTLLILAIRPRSDNLKRLECCPQQRQQKKI